MSVKEIYEKYKHLNHLLQEKTYSTKELIERLNNALENGYEELGETDIGDLLLECDIAELYLQRCKGTGQI